jgi:hypothetical protein
MQPLPPRLPWLQDEDSSLSLVQLLATTSGMVTVVCEVVALVAMLPFLLMEVRAGDGGAHAAIMLPFLPMLPCCP